MNMPDEKALRHLNAALNLEPLWIPFTANRQFKAAPRLLVAAKDMYYQTHDGRKVLDGIAGLWAVNAGHCRQPIVDAIKKQAETMDYATGFQMHHPGAFQAAEKLVSITPKGMDHVFFTNSGSEAVDTALKIALAYHRVRGEGTRRILIGRERGYHGVGFGGISVGGMVGNRKTFGNMLALGRPPAPHPRSGAQRVLARPARARRRIRRRPGTPGRSCTTLPTSLPSSSSRSRAPPACCCRRRATCRSCARSATSTASC